MGWYAVPEKRMDNEWDIPPNFEIPHSDSPSLSKDPRFQFPPPSSAFTLRGYLRKYIMLHT